jgi:hypothetical protein
MHLTLSPIRGLPGQAETVLSVAGDLLDIDGLSYDLSAVPEGGEALPQGDGHPFIGPITREEGVIHATLRVILGDAAAPDQPDSPWSVAAGDGPVSIPALRIIPEDQP